MTVDHLLGTEREAGESVPVDPGAFVISVALSVAAAALVFGWLVPRARRRGPERAAVTGLVLSVTSVVPGIVFWWLGFPLVVAGGGLALGVEASTGPRRSVALAAAALGALVLGAVAVLYAVAAIV